MTPKILIVAAAAALASPWAGAQNVWRCGNSYSEQPCAGGSAVTISEPVSGRPAGTPVGLTDAKLAAQLEKARLEQERNAPKAIIMRPPTAVTAPPVEGGKDGTKAKTGKLEQFTAVAPGHPKDKSEKNEKSEKKEKGGKGAKKEKAGTKETQAKGQVKKAEH